MENRKILARSLILSSLLVAAVMLIRVLAAAEAPFDVELGPSDKSSYLLGDTVRIPGSAQFAETGVSQLEATLIIDGPQPVVQSLPVEPGSYSFPETDLDVTVNVERVPTSGGTLPGQSDTRIDYEFDWSPPLFLDPPPDYSLIPDAVAAFGIPLVTPTPVPGQEGFVDLPDTIERFEIPLVGMPEPGKPVALPSAELAPALLSLPPMTKVGSRPASPRIEAIRLVVVVLPWVPAMAMPWR